MVFYDLISGHFVLLELFLRRSFWDNSERALRVCCVRATLILRRLPLFLRRVVALLAITFAAIILMWRVDVGKVRPIILNIASGGLLLCYDSSRGWLKSIAHFWYDLGVICDLTTLEPRVANDLSQIGPHIWLERKQIADQVDEVQAEKAFWFVSAMDVPKFC